MTLGIVATLEAGPKHILKRRYRLVSAGMAPLMTACPAFVRAEAKGEDPCPRGIEAVHRLDVEMRGERISGVPDGSEALPH